mgnify:FL=1
MRQYIKYMLSILILTIVIFETIILAILCNPKGVFKTSYQSIIVDKYRI